MTSLSPPKNGLPQLSVWVGATLSAPTLDLLQGCGEQKKILLLNFENKFQENLHTISIQIDKYQKCHFASL